jgi:hypothetical protein
MPADCHHRAPRQAPLHIHSAKWMPHVIPHLVLCSPPLPFKRAPSMPLAVSATPLLPLFLLRKHDMSATLLLPCLSSMAGCHSHAPHLPLFSLVLQDPTAATYENRSASPPLKRHRVGPPPRRNGACTACPTPPHPPASRTTARAARAVITRWAHRAALATRTTRAVLSSDQANSAGPWAEMPAHHSAAIFQFSIFIYIFRKSYKLQKFIENTIKLNKYEINCYRILKSRSWF